jgi:hypothetical protein
MGGHVTGRTRALAGIGGSRSLVPVLMVVFVIAWGMLTVLIVLQDRMIDAQRDLIHVLFKDTIRQAALKPVLPQTGKAAAQNKKGSKHSNQGVAGNDRDEQSATAQSVPGKSAAGALSQVPLSEDASSSQAPSSQVKPKSADKSGRSSRKMRSPFSRPPAEITDPSDKRRVSISI